MILGVQRWLCLFPNHFVDEPSDAGRHEQDRSRVVPDGGHHRVEDVTEVWPARTQALVDERRDVLPMLVASAQVRRGLDAPSQARVHA